MSGPLVMLEHMFDFVPQVEAVARFDELVERHSPSTTAESAALVDRICAAARAENREAAAQLVAIHELFTYRLSRCAESEDWAIDTMDAVAAEVAAALRISQGLAGSRLRYARAMCERLPQVGEVFKAGDIDYRLFQTIVYRTDLITDDDVLAAVDAQLAVNVVRWPSMTHGWARRWTRSWPRRMPMRCGGASSARPTARSGSVMWGTAWRRFRAVC